MEVGETADAEEAVFVMFTCEADEERLIPMAAIGQVGEAEGVVTVETMSVEDARHFAEDAGASADEIAAITEPQTSIRIAGPAARIEL